MSNPNREWLIWFTVHNDFAKRTGSAHTLEPTATDAFTYAEARALVRGAAASEWPDDQPPVVMVRTVDPSLPPSTAVQLYTKAINEAVAAMVKDRETADWTHPVPVGGLPEEPDFVPSAMARLLADCETQCTSGCDNGTIDNRAARDAWRAEHATELNAFREERRRTRSATATAEESALTRTEPRLFLTCDCNGTGFVLTADGRALVEFLDRHRPTGHDHPHDHEGWA